MTEPVVRVQNLRKLFGDNEVLKGIDLDVMRGEVVVVFGEKDLSETVPGSEVAPHLARHGISVTVTDLSLDRGDVAETLRRRAVLFGADMMVMGAYVHSRLREFVLGGTTQSLLKSSPVPLLLSS